MFPDGVLCKADSQNVSWVSNCACFACIVVPRGTLGSFLDGISLNVQFSVGRYILFEFIWISLTVEDISFWHFSWFLFILSIYVWPVLAFVIICYFFSYIFPKKVLATVLLIFGLNIILFIGKVKSDMHQKVAIHGWFCWAQKLSMIVGQAWFIFW